MKQSDYTVLLPQILDQKPSRGEKRRIQILQATVDCIATIGIDNTSFDSVGKKLKINRAHVAYYFPSREILLLSTVRYVIATAQQEQKNTASSSSASSWKKRLEEVIENPFHWIGKNPKYASVIALFYYFTTHDPKFRDIQNTFRTIGEERLVGCLQTLVDTDKLLPKEAREIARTIQSLIAGQMIFFYSCDFPLDLKTLTRSTVDTAFRLIQSYTELKQAGKK